MSRKKVEIRKVPMGVSVLETTKDYIKTNKVNAGKILDEMFKDK